MIRQPQCHALESKQGVELGRSDLFRPNTYNVMHNTKCVKICIHICMHKLYFKILCDFMNILHCMA